MNKHEFRTWVTIAVAALVLSSCATRIPYRKPVDAAALFPEGASAYIRLEGKLLNDAAEVLLSPEDLRSVQPFLDRTDRATAAFFPLAACEPPAKPGEAATVYGIAEGDYPAGAASFRLSLSRHWRKEGKAFASKDDTLRIAFADKGLLAAGNGNLEPLLEKMPNPGPHPVPEDLRPLWNAEGAIWLSKPETLLKAAMGAEAPTIPVQGVLLSLVPDKTSCAGTWVFLFADPRGARVFGPVCRLAHAAFLRIVYASDTEGMEAALVATRWETSGSRVYATGFDLPIREVFSAFLGAL